VRRPFLRRGDEAEVPVPVDGDVGLEALTDHQSGVAREIINCILDDHCQLMFLQGSAGTGKTFTVRAIIESLRARGKHCLICGTTRMAAVQYLGGTTLHSLFRLGIDDRERGGFASNIGRNSIDARYILRGDLIVIDEVSMLTPAVANRVSLTLKCIAQSREDFGAKKILFVGDLLQLPPVVRNSSVPVVYRLITRMPCWHSMRKFRLERPMRCPDPNWAAFISQVSRGESEDLPNWNQLQDFGVTVTNDLDDALVFICQGCRPNESFPLDRQWIAGTNRLANQVNLHLQEWRRVGQAACLGTSVARSELPVPFPN
jgi:hypothetical protein